MQLSHPEDKGSMFFYTHMVQKPQKKNIMWEINSTTVNIWQEFT